jgi:mRNA-degrading endonuclease YafQ of YafQ-DinJ toxin-antitoxin module
MIGYVGVDEQVAKDFHRALRRVSIHRFRDWVLRRLRLEIHFHTKETEHELLCRFGTLRDQGAQPGTDQ